MERESSSNTSGSATDILSAARFQILKTGIGADEAPGEKTPTGGACDYWRQARRGTTSRRVEAGDHASAAAPTHHARRSPRWGKMAQHARVCVSSAPHLQRRAVAMFEASEASVSPQ